MIDQRAMATWNEKWSDMVIPPSLPYLLEMQSAGTWHYLNVKFVSHNCSPVPNAFDSHSKTENTAG